MRWEEQHPSILEGQMIVSSNEQKLSEELLRPCNIKKPRIFKDGDSWIALLGDNFAEGVTGSGATPEEACQSFDKYWNTGK